jgi:hypothetical protein
MLPFVLLLSKPDPEADADPAADGGGDDSGCVEDDGVFELVGRAVAGGGEAPGSPPWLTRRQSMGPAVLLRNI